MNRLKIPFVLLLLPFLLAFNFASAQRVVFIGDVHVEDSTQFGYFQRTILDALTCEEGLDACIWLGDIVNESPGWIAPMASCIRHFPSYAVMGNHDFDTRVGVEAGAWRKEFGEENYSLKLGKTYFVCVNNARGTYPDEAFALVCKVPSKSRLVLCAHVPLGSVSNGREMLALLSARKGESLLMSAHKHIVCKETLAPNVREITVGSVCTTWWRGVPTDKSIPYAPSQCGSPRNYFVIELWCKKPQVELRNIDNPGEQMRLDITDGIITVNVFAAAPDAKVTLSVDGGPAIPMLKSERMDPEVARLRDYSASMNYPRKDTRRSVYLNRPSPHLWELPIVDLPDTNSPAAHAITVNATDSFGLSISQTFIRHF